MIVLQYLKCIDILNRAWETTRHRCTVDVWIAIPITVIMFPNSNQKLYSPYMTAIYTFRNNNYFLPAKRFSAERRIYRLISNYAMLTLIIMKEGVYWIRSCSPFFRASADRLIGIGTSLRLIIPQSIRVKIIVANRVLQSWEWGAGVQYVNNVGIIFIQTIFGWMLIKYWPRRINTQYFVNLHRRNEIFTSFKLSNKIILSQTKWS